MKKIMALFLAICLLPCLGTAFAEEGGAERTVLFEPARITKSDGTTQVTALDDKDYDAYFECYAGIMTDRMYIEFAEAKKLSEVVLYVRQTNIANDLQSWDLWGIGQDGSRAWLTNFVKGEVTSETPNRGVMSVPDAAAAYSKYEISLGAGYAVLTEVEFLGTAAVTLPADGNIAKGKPVRQVNSSSVSDDVNLTNGNFSDYAQLYPNANGYMQVDLGGYYSLKELFVTCMDVVGNRSNFSVAADKYAGFSGDTVSLLASYGNAAEGNGALAGFNHIDADETKTFRFIRISLINGNTSTAICELEAYLYNGAPSTEGNLAYGKGVTLKTASGTLAPAFGTAEALTDGKLTTFLGINTAGTSAGAITVDLGDSFDLGSVVVCSRHDLDGNDWHNFRLLASDDRNFASYDVLATENGNVPYGKNVEASITNTVSYRYLRIEQSSAAWNLWSELAAYAKDAEFTSAIKDISISMGLVESVTMQLDATAAESSTLVIAVYDGSELKDIVVANAVTPYLNFSKQEFTYEPERKIAAESGNTVKAFLWGQFDVGSVALKPIVKVFGKTA